MAYVAFETISSYARMLFLHDGQPSLKYKLLGLNNMDSSMHVLQKV